MTSKLPPTVVAVIMDHFPLSNRSVSIVLTIAATLLLTRCSLLSEQDSSSALDCSVQTMPTPTEMGCSSLTDLREAQLLSVWLTGKLRPDTTLTGRFCQDLDRLREQFSDSYPVVANSRFQAAWTSRELALKFDGSSATAIREGTYEGWKELPSFLCPDTLLSPPDKLGWGQVGFDEVYNMKEVANQYERVLPGLRVGEPNAYMFAGFSTHPILPLWNGEMLGLVFTGGSSHAPFYFFRVTNGTPEFIERWDGEGNPPKWLKDAREAWENGYTPES